MRFTADADHGAPAVAPAVASQLSASLTMEELERLRAAFAQLDRDGDGYVTVDELAHALQRVPGEVARFDHNRDGRLDLSEFIDFSAHVKVRAAPALSAVSSVTHHHRRIPGAQAGKAAEAKAAAAPAPATSA